MQGGTPACAGAAGGAQTDGSVCVCARTHTARANRTQAGSPLELRPEREPPGRSVISTTSHSPHGGSWGRPAWPRPAEQPLGAAETLHHKQRAAPHPAWWRTPELMQPFPTAGAGVCQGWPAPSLWAPSQLGRPAPGA